MSPDKQNARLARILAIRTIAFKATVFGMLGLLVVGPLLVIVSEPFGDLSDLGSIIQILGLAAGFLGALTLFFVTFVECPFCKRFFFYNWFFVWVLRNTCVNCGRGIK